MSQGPVALAPRDTVLNCLIEYAAAYGYEEILDGTLVTTACTELASPRTDRA